MYSLVIPKLLCGPIWGNSRWWKYHEKRFIVNMPKCLVVYQYVRSRSQSWFSLLPGCDQLQAHCFSKLRLSVLSQRFSRNRPNTQAKLLLLLLP